MKYILPTLLLLPTPAFAGAFVVIVTGAQEEPSTTETLIQGVYGLMHQLLALFA